MIDFDGVGQAGLTNGAESESFVSVDALRRANLIATSDREAKIDLSVMHTWCVNHFYKKFQLF